MPWHVGAAGSNGCPDGKYPVVKDSTGEKVSCHDTKAKASAQVRLLYAKEKNMALADESPAAEAPKELPNGWRGAIAPLNRPTGDERQLNTPDGGVRYRQFPMSFRFCPAALGGHDGAVMVGRIDYAWDQDGYVYGEGALDLGGEWGAEFARRLGDGFAFTVSLDPDEITFEQQFFNADGEQVPFDEAVTTQDGAPALKDGYDVRDVMTDWRVSSATAVDIPAFDEARIEPVYDYVPRSTAPAMTYLEALAALLAYEGEDPAELATLAQQVRNAPLESETGEPEIDETIVAAAGGQVFRRESFEDPKLTGPTPLTVTDDGRVFGHVAEWSSCYMAFGGDVNKPCITVPHSQTGYERFHVHGARLEDGTILPVGAITFGDGHRTAGGLRASQRQYAEIATIGAKVRAGEDEFGIWVAGEVLDQFRDRQYDLLLSPLSGHWEPDLDVAGNLEMLAAHVVVTPGFKVPRLVASVDEDGNYTAVQFAGVQRTYLETAEALVDAALREGSVEITGATEDGRVLYREVIVAAAHADRRAQKALRKLGLDCDTRAAAALQRLGIKE